MVKTEILNVNGKMVQGVCISSPGGEGHPNMLLIVCSRGYIMCGYLNLEAAGKFGDAACIIGGSSFEEILQGKVKAKSEEAEKMGITLGMTGSEACDILNG